VRRLPTTLADRVKKFYDFVISRDLHEHEHAIMTGLSTSLRTEVILYLYQVRRVILCSVPFPFTISAVSLCSLRQAMQEALDTLPFMKDKHPQFIVQLVSHFKLEFYSPGGTSLVPALAAGHHPALRPTRTPLATTTSDPCPLPRYRGAPR